MQKIPSYQLQQFSEVIHNNPIRFAEEVLGVKLHLGQKKWIDNARKRINILRPGNRWGKTLVLAIRHLWHAMCKPNLDGRVSTYGEWLKVEYQILNFGPTYELGRGVLQMARDIAEGRLLLPTGTTNDSALKGWAITEDRSDAAALPYIEFKTGTRLLGRSYSEMGVAFKMKSIAYLTGDECADIEELWTFTNNTLLPRVVSLNGQIDFAGTPQPNGIDYMIMIEMAEEDMKNPNWQNQGHYYTQRGSMYENEFLPKEAVREIEAVADPSLREQIIRGEYVEIGEKYFGFERIQNAVDKSLNQVTDWDGGKYIVSADFAGGESQWADHTVILVIDYFKEPYNLVHFVRFKGGDISIPAQYNLVEQITKNFRAKLIIDNTSLGGKNANAFLGHLHPIPFDITPKLKADMLASLKIAFDGGQNPRFRRERVKTKDGWQEKNPNWGLIKIPPIPVLVTELQNYRLDDAKIRNDCVMALGQAIHWIEMRRPKMIRRQAAEFDLIALS
ncbi:MAG: hypothetical protein ACOYWZ_16165 [Bacillota bacterium]